MTKLLSYLLGAGVLLSGCGVSQTEVEATVVPAIATPLDDSTTITNVPAPEETAWGERRIKRVADKSKLEIVFIYL